MKATFMHERQGIRCLDCNEFLMTANELEYINPKDMITDPVKEHWGNHIQAIEKEIGL